MRISQVWGNCWRLLDEGPGCGPGDQFCYVQVEDLAKTYALSSMLIMHQEVTANYGYMEKYLATEAGIQMMLTVGQVRVEGF